MMMATAIASPPFDGDIYGRVQSATTSSTMKTEMCASGDSIGTLRPPGSPVSSTLLPTSVRGAPPQLRRQIRKRQNSESAKRCRQRKKIESVRATEELLVHAQHLARLEALVAHLARSVDATAAVVADIASRVAPPRCSACAGSGCAACASSAAPMPHTTSRPPLEPHTHPSASAFGADRFAPPQPPPLPTPVKRSLAMMSAGMPVGPAQVRAVRAAQAAQAQAAQAQAARAQASMESLSTQTVQLQLALGERHDADVMALATKVDELESSGWN